MPFKTSPKIFRGCPTQRRKVFVLAQFLVLVVLAAGANVSHAQQVTVTGVNPNAGPTSGGNVIELLGSNFWPSSQVWIGGLQAPITKFVNSTQMYVQVPPHVPAMVEIDVFDGSTSVARDFPGYLYQNSGTKDSVSSVSPASIPASQTATITVSGSGFPSGAKIEVNGKSLGTTYTNSSSLKATAPALAAGTYAVGVLNPDGSSASSSVKLAYAASSGGSGTSSGTPAGTALSACGPITKSGTYYLANDVTCTNVGFALNANNITFNLNGHTIYYGSTSEVVPAISICDTWYGALPASACGSGQHVSPSIYNGKIVQNKGTAPFTHAIWIGEANGIKPGTIDYLTITIQQPGTQAIYGSFPGSGWNIHNNTINDNVTSIQLPGQGVLSARAQFQGMVITMYNGGNASGSGDLIWGNTINGTPQGGIYDSNQNTQIYSNVITMTSWFSNDYGVLILADGQQVHNNTIQGRGRGIDAETSKWSVYNNTIHVHEETNNSEYGGCELDGSDGIRIKNYGTPSTGWKITGNTVQVDATYCQANGLRFTQLLSGVNGTISGNTFKTIAGNGPDYALSLEQSQSSTVFSGNTFNGSTCTEIDWDGANQTVQSGQHWSCPSMVVYDGDGALGGGVLTSPSLNLQDSFSGTPKVFCGNYAASLNRIGSYTKQCH